MVASFVAVGAGLFVTVYFVAWVGVLAAAVAAVAAFVVFVVSVVVSFSYHSFPTCVSLSASNTYA